MPSPSEIDAALAPPGSGLPWPELVVGRVMFRALRLAWSREAALRRFVGKGRRLAVILRGLNDDTGARRVLVPRLMGLEDSSRHWSPFMIARHLCIVNGDALAIIRALCADRTPEGHVTMAGLKPSPDAGRTAVDELERLIGAYEREIPVLAGWPGAGRHAHPWFGPLDAHGWLCMTAMHHGIHARQLKCVLRLVGSRPEGRAD